MATSKKNNFEGHRERVREEFLKFGLGHFPHHKLLEMLLYFTIPRGDTNQTARLLLERFGSFSQVIDAPIGLLTRVEGIGKKSALHIRYVGSIIRPYMEDLKAGGKLIKSIDDGKDFMRHKFIGESDECFYLVCLGAGWNVIYFDKIFQGTHTEVNITIDKIVQNALICKAAKAVVAHNHPHGLCNPSNQDLRTTNLLYEELKRVGVELMDHLIVAPGGIYSMVENGMFPVCRA